MASITKTLHDVAIEGAQDELTDCTVYKRLSAREKKADMGQVLLHLADMEYRHYQFWSRYCADAKIVVSSSTIYFVLFLRLLFGSSFVVRYLERHEAEVIRRYKSVSNLIPAEDKQQFDMMISDEEEHENGFALEMQKGRVSYLSFVVLGLADALVEISGIHAGSLGIYNSTELTGLAGVIAGAAASVAMASAAYAQAKSGFKGSAGLSALYTGVSYFICAVILAAPYFLTGIQVVALSGSLFLAVLIIAFSSYYNSVVLEESFKRDFLELAGIMFGATALLYVIGSIVRALLGGALLGISV